MSAPSPFPPPPGHDDLGSQADPARWHDFTVAGLALRGRVPSPAGLHAFTTATSPHVSATIQTDMTWIFLRDHLHPDSVESIMSVMIDPDSGWDTARLGEVIRVLATLGTARPFGQSPRSQRRRRITGA